MPAPNVYPVPFPGPPPTMPSGGIRLTVPEIAGAGRRGVPVVGEQLLPGSLEEFLRPAPQQLKFTPQGTGQFIQIQIDDRVTYVLEPADSGPLVKLDLQLADQWDRRRREIADLENKIRAQAQPPLDPAPVPAPLPKRKEYGMLELPRIVLMLDSHGRLAQLHKQFFDEWRALSNELARIRAQLYPLFLTAIERELKQLVTPPDRTIAILSSICTTLNCLFHVERLRRPSPRAPAPYRKLKEAKAPACLVPWSYPVPTPPPLT